MYGSKINGKVSCKDHFFKSDGHLASVCEKISKLCFRRSIGLVQILLKLLPLVYGVSM